MSVDGKALYVNGVLLMQRSCAVVTHFIGVMLGQEFVR